MCTGTQTQMSCGHVLTHYTRRCARARARTGAPPCPDPRLDAPRSYIADSCAQCDPSYNANRARREHRDRHTALVEEVIARQRAGRAAEAQALMARVGEATREAILAVGEARFRCRAAAADVEFPGQQRCGEVARGMTSRWVGGKCVWEEEKGEGEGEDEGEEEGGREWSRITGPPRLKNSRKEYIVPSDLEPPEIERLQITGPPRFRTNKPYPGPRDNVVVVVQEPERQQPSPVPHRLRRTNTRVRRLSNGSDHGSVVTVVRVGSEEQNNGPSGSHGTERPAARTRTRHAMQKANSEDEDIWLRLARQ